MAEIPKTPTDWAGMWLESQKGYMDAWAELLRRGSEGAAPTAVAGPEALRKGVETWWQMITAALPQGSRDVAHQLFDAGKGYWQVGDAFSKFVEAAQSMMAGGTDSQKALQEGLKRFQESVCGTGAQTNPWSGFATFCGMPLDNWRRVVSSLSAMPGDMEKALRAEGPAGPDAFRGAMGRLLSVPPLGYTREWQEELQEWGELWLKHGQAFHDYQTELGQVASRAIDKLGTRLLKRSQDGKPVESLREAYDLWVDCGEDAYAEVATSATFIAAQARLTNTLMAVKRHEQQLMAELQSGLNMPTRRELDTSHRRVQELRRALRGVENDLEDLDLPSLRKDLDALRAQVRALEAGRDGKGGASKGAPGKAASTPRRTRVRTGEGG